MSVPSKRETDKFIEKLLKSKNIYWEDLGISEGLYVKDIKRTINKWRIDPQSVSPAAQYFCEQLQRAEAMVKLGLYDTAMIQPQFAEKALALKDARYSLAIKNQLRSQAICLIKALKTVCNDPINKDCSPQEIYESTLRLINESDLTDETKEINDLLESWDLDNG